MPPDQGVHAGTVKIDPNRREEVLYGMLRERVVGWPELGDYEHPVTPMAWIEATRDSANDQHPWHPAMSASAVIATARRAQSLRDRPRLAGLVSTSDGS